MKETFYKGAAGNLSMHSVTLGLAALAANGVAVASANLPIGTQITAVRIINDALGSDTEVTAQVVSRNGDSTDLAAFSTVAAGDDVTYIKPHYVGDEGPSDLVVKNTGTGAATGEVVLQIEYRYKGY